MAALSHAESRRLYSWWWDSHISPKNSKWLQENLADMDVKVKAMIKVIEEDADSFRKRAEMYYKRRPELMKLVEEFYRAYRALAERYDHATGALRQAHRTMAEAFPDQVPQIFLDELPTGSSTDAEPHTPEMPRGDCDDLQKDAADMSSRPTAFKRNGVLSEDSKVNKGGFWKSTTGEEFADGWARNGLDFQNVEGKGSGYKLQHEVQQLSEECQKLKSQLMLETERAVKAEAEAVCLRDIISKLESEKEAFSLQYHQSQEKRSGLEANISRIQEDLKKLNGEILVETSKSRSFEDRCQQLKEENQSLQLELGTLKEIADNRQDELILKQGELEKLNISLQEERSRYMQAETDRLSFEKLHSQSQEEVKVLSLEIRNWMEKLMNMEMRKVGLEEEIQRLKEEIGSLNEQISSCALKIKSLLDEISQLEEAKRKLEDEVGLHIKEKKSLQEEVLSVKADKSYLEERHHELSEQIGTVNLNVESLQEMVKELRDGNVELKELCKKNEDERLVHLEGLKFLEKIAEQNATLEDSLTNANAELEELRATVNSLEESCEMFRGKISVHLSEKAVLVSQIEAIAQNMEKLSETNVLLENSLSDVNVELEGLRGKLNGLEESCRSLRDENAILLAEKTALVSQIENLSHTLENLEVRYAELEAKNLNLEKEKDQELHQVRELQHSLRVQKDDYETLVQSSRSQIDGLEYQICILKGVGQLRERELEADHHKIVNAQLEIYILRSILHDMKETNVLLSDKCQKYQETFKSQEELISELRQESFMQKERRTWLSQCNDKLVEGVLQVMMALKVCEECQSLDDLNFKLVLHEIENLKTSIVDTQDDNQCLVLEKSVILTLLEQHGLELAELQLEKEALERELKMKIEELLVLRSEKHQVLCVNEQLTQSVEACRQREEVLKVKMEILCNKLSHVQAAHSALQGDVAKFIEENQSFSKKISDLSEENERLEEDNSALYLERANLEHLYLFFRNFAAERALALQSLSDNMDHLRTVNCGLEQEVVSLKEKLGAVGVENMNMKESLINLEECRRGLVILEDEVKTASMNCQELNRQLDAGKNLLAEREGELSLVNHKFQAVQDQNAELNEKIEILVMDIDKVKVEKEELEKKNHSLLQYNTKRDDEISELHYVKDTLGQQLDKLSEEVEELKKREKYLTSELEGKIQDVKSCEVEIESLLNEVHVKTIDAANFEEKMIELLITCESVQISSMVQNEMFYDEITRRNVYENELRRKLDTLDGEKRSLKDELSAYLSLILSLGSFITSLEEQIFRLADHPTLSSCQKKDDSRPQKTNEEENEDHHTLSSFGILELQKLHAMASTLEKVVIDILSHLEHERDVSRAASQDAERESEGSKLEGTTDLVEAQRGNDVILHLKWKEDAGNLKNGNADIFENKSEEIMKDIQLDHVLSSSPHGNSATSCMSNAPGTDETEDHMIKLWETINSNKMEKPSPVTSERDLNCQQIEAVEEEKSVCPSSDPTAGNELSIDKLELTKNTESHQQWSGSISERLSSDANKLSVLQKSAQELRRNMDLSELSNTPTSFEFKKVRAQLKEAEAVISHLIDSKNKLTRKAEKLSSSPDSLSLLTENMEDLVNTSERKILERAQRGSEKIGRLELELQKLEYIWLKLKEEHDYKKARAAERRTSVLLRDYLYGRREGSKRKKGHCCACIRPRTMEE